MPKFLFLLLSLWRFCVSQGMTSPPANVAPGSRQLLLVNVSTLGKGLARRFEFRKGGWIPSGPEFSVSLGKAGTTSAAEKVEGDLKTPEGTFKILKAFAREPHPNFKIPLTQITRHDKWIDDPESPQYNQWVRGTTTAKSFEHLWREDHNYDLLFTLDFNTGPVVPKKGSAIFIHQWRGPDQPTAGCIAMSRENLLSLGAWLDPKAHPVISFRGP